MRFIILAAFFLLLHLVGAAGSAIALVQTDSFFAGCFYVFLLALNARGTYTVLSDIVLMLLERRRDAQLVWAIHWWARAKFPGAKVTVSLTRGPAGQEPNRTVLRVVR